MTSQQGDEPAIPGLAADQAESDDRPGVGIHRPKHPIPPQPATVTPAPALLKAGKFAPSPVRDLVRVDSSPHLPRAVRQRGKVGILHRRSQATSREVGETTVEGLCPRESVTTDDRGQEGLLELAEVIWSARTAPCQTEPEQACGERGQPPLRAVQVVSERQLLCVREQVGQRGEVSRLGDGGRYTGHEDRSPEWGDTLRMPDPSLFKL